MSKESVVSQELFRVLNARLADAEAKNRDRQYEVQVLASIDKTANALIELGAKDADVAGMLRFREKLGKKLIKLHKVGADELVPAKQEGEA